MIDTHIHVVPPNLPGVGALSPVLRGATEHVVRILREQMDQAGMKIALAMGSLPTPDDPLGIGRTLEIAEAVPGLYPIGVIDPERIDSPHLSAVEGLLKTGQVMALKAYLGYVHRFPADPGYRPYYDLAERYKVPVVFHTGDTYSPFAKLKYAHPINIDEVAVDHPKVRFVMAHVGNPWMLDAAEVVYKNVNVWVDLSGLLLGDTVESNDAEQLDERREVVERIQKAFRYAQRPNRFLYGSDWPLAPMAAYRDFIREAIPTEYHDLIFTENAQLVFGIDAL
jgi:predicted TIM-barrel fold metal-dependent hydrolase